MGFGSQIKPRCNVMRRSVCVMLHKSAVHVPYSIKALRRINKYNLHGKYRFLKTHVLDRKTISALIWR